MKAVVILLLLASPVLAQSGTQYFKPDGSYGGSAQTDTVDDQSDSRYYNENLEYQGRSHTQQYDTGSHTDFWGSDGDYKGSADTVGDEP